MGRAAIQNVARAVVASAMDAGPSVSRSGGYSFQSVGGQELNFVDTSLDNANVSTTAQVALLNGMAQGTTASTRIGRRINMKSVELRLRMNTQATTSSTTVRYALVYDKQANAVAPAFTDIYDSATPTALRNISNKARFWVLYDSGLVNLSGASGGTSQTDSTRQSLECYKKINLPVQYNAGVAGTVGDIQTGALYWVAIGDVASGTASAVSVGTARIRYSD